LSKFNVTKTRPAVSSPVVSESTPSSRTYEGAAGYARDTKSELFLLAVSNMVGENTFYEKAGDRDSRYTQLVHDAALADPEWTARLLNWLRSEANMRTASLVGAAEFVKARLEVGADSGVSNRAVIDSVLQRADEPGELLAYWTSTHGRAIPKPIKRGVADAVRRLYHERSFLKWDSDARGYRFGDVLELTHPAPADDRQGDLFAHAIDKRHGRADAVPSTTLEVLGNRAALAAWPVEKRRALFKDPVAAAAVLRDAGMTWEAVAGWLQGPLTKDVWEALAPTMGYMALARNLRNFDEAGVSDEVAAMVAAKLSDPGQVARSRQLPMRFLSAYRAAPSLRWGHALDKALTHSLTNIPRLPGRTLVLVDTSSSMNAGFSKDGTLMRWDAAAVFGIALGARCEHADVVSFSSNQRFWGDPPGANTKQFKLQTGESLLRSVDRWKNDGYFLGGGTDTVGAIQRHLRPGFHDRLVIVTDEQAEQGDVGRAVPADLPLYTWNLAGYRHGHSTSGSHNRHTFAGLGDHGFRMIPLLEAGKNADWPF
jgi:hypothetical protein